MGLDLATALIVPLDAVPLAAASGTEADLMTLFLMLLAAKIGDEIFKRIHQPAIVGEILAGVLIGPSVLKIIEPNSVTEAFAELGVVFLLFWVGLETPLSQLKSVGKSAVSVGVLGVVVPLIGGAALGVALGEDLPSSVFLGAALVATSVGITSAVLLAVKRLKTRAGQTIIGAAVVDDILAMLLVAVAVGLASENGIDIASTIAVLVLAIAFIAFVGLGGSRLLRAKPHLLQLPKFAQTPLVPAVLICLGLAALSAEIGLAAIIGAFLAGLIIAETLDHSPVEKEIAPLYAFFPPFFFVSIGMQVDLDALGSATALGLLALVTAVAIATKFVGAWLGARGLDKREALLVAVGMIPRGEVGIVVAGLGAAAGVFDAEMFAVIVGMSVFTTLITPPLIKRLAEQVPAEAD